MPEIDLARLADGYEYRPPSDATLERARRAGAELETASAILDVGGGPGHHAEVWTGQGHHPIVLDPAADMTRPAVERGLVVVRGVAQALPFRDAVFDLVWFHLSIHYGDWRGAVDEAARVTRSGGRIEVWTLAADHHEASMLAMWFPSIPDLDRQRFPESAAVESYLGDRAPTVSLSSVVEHKTRAAGEWAAAAEAGFVSTLQLVPADELAAGMAAFRAAYPDPTIQIDYELRLDRIAATL